MSKTIELMLAPRSATGKANKKLRRQGLLPGVIYGFNVKEGVAVQVEERTFERVYHQAGNVHLIDVREGETGPMTRVFVHGVTRDPITHVLNHVDFIAVNLRQEMTAHVPIVLVGESPAVTDNIGVLLQNLDELDVKVLPDAVPESFQVDVSGLAEVGATIYVKDLPIPAGVTLLSDPEEVVARITAARAQAEEEEAPTEAAAEAAEAEEGAESTDTAES